MVFREIRHFPILTYRKLAEYYPGKFLSVKSNVVIFQNLQDFLKYTHLRKYVSSEFQAVVFSVVKQVFVELM